MLERLTDVVCPKCDELVRVYSEPGESLVRSQPPRCLDCKVSLYEEVQEALKPFPVAVAG